MARAALEQVTGCSAREARRSAGLIAVAGVLAYVQGKHAWLGLFAVLLLPLLVAGLAARCSRWLLPESPGQGLVWLLLCAVVLLSALSAVHVYRYWMGFWMEAGLRDIQVLASVALFGLLTLGIPLRHANSQAAALRVASLEKAALSAELKALQAQIEPHFLYNTLANTRYLARHNPDKAVLMLDHLIAYLHSALPDMRGSDSTLGREFELAEHYLALMAIRFGERLRFELDCPDALRGAAVPPLLLMSLVENAVQHGVEPVPGAVCVRLAASQAHGQLRIVVSNDGAGAATQVLGSGVGLRNLRARLQAQFGAAASFALRIEEGRATEAELRLPMQAAA